MLRKLYVDGQRIKIERILDYYHASERLTVIADSLKLTAHQRSMWLSRMRKLLLEPGGWGRMMRSIATMKERYGVKKSKSELFAEAKRYLRRYKKFMNYAEQRDRGCPISSGIVESTCKDRSINNCLFLYPSPCPLPFQGRGGCGQLFLERS